MFADHIVPIRLTLGIRRPNEYLILGDIRVPLPLVAGVIEFPEAHTSASIENVTLTCVTLDFEAQAEKSVFRFRLQSKERGFGSAFVSGMEGQVESRDGMSRIQLWRGQCADYSPVVLQRKEPGYTNDARRARLEGTVELLVDIDTSGFAYDIRILRGLGSGLDEEASGAVKEWKFAPFAFPKPACQIRVSIPFRLR